MMNAGEQSQKKYDGIYAISEEYGRHYKDSIYYVVWTQVMKFLKQFPSPKILEIACGAGQFANYLYDEEYRDYHGFDFSAEAIKKAKERVPLSFSVGNAMDKNAYTHDYNLAIALEVLEHVGLDFDVIGNLRQGTPIIFSLPTFSYPGHVRWFTTPRQIKRRYFRCIDISKIVPVDSWFVCMGTVQRFDPKWINRLLGTRRRVDMAFLVKHFTGLVRRRAERLRSRD